MSAGDKRSKAKTIVAEVDALFHTAEKANPEHNVTYLDIVRISDRVREHFDNKTPPQIEAALSVANGLCHPEKLAGVAMIKKGLGGLMACAGGGALLWGIVYTLAIGLTATATTGMLWWKTTTVTILFGGPIGIAIGIASLAVGIYVLSLKAPAKKRAVMALDIVKKGIENWVATDSQRALPAIEWIKKLTEDEFFALVSLAWHLADADLKQTQEEMVIIDHILNIRKPNEKAVAEGIGSTPVKQAIETLRNSKYADKCFELLKMIPEADGSVSQEEAEIIGLFEI
jgi:hypothetical protein